MRPYHFYKILIKIQLIYTQNINQNITETLRAIECLSQYIKNFPENEREIATVHLEDLKHEVEKHEQSKPQKIKAYFMAFLKIAIPLLSCVANTTDFLNNVTDLGGKFNIELPSDLITTQRQQ